MNRILTDLVTDIEVGRVAFRDEELEGISIRHTTIGDNDNGMRKGNYHVISVPCSVDTLSAVSSLSRIIGGYTSQCQRLLIVGFGNDEYMCDRLGASTIDNIDVTITSGVEVATFEPSVEAKTGISSSRLVRAVVREYKPSLVLAIDTLATSRMAHLASSIQVTDAGLNPGAGVGGKGIVIDSEYLGVDTLAIGVPLVVSMEREYLIPSTIDSIVSRYAHIIAHGIIDAIVSI